MFGLLLLGALGLIGSLMGGESSDSSDDYSFDYDYDDSYSNDNETEERFENRYPYEYDKQTGYYRSSYYNNGNWSDSMGNQYEQVTDCWGNITYEKIDED